MPEQVKEIVSKELEPIKVLAVLILKELSEVREHLQKLEERESN